MLEVLLVLYRVLYAFFYVEYAYKARAVPAVGLVCAHKLGFYLSEYQKPACARTTGRNCTHL